MRAKKEVEVEVKDEVKDEVKVEDKVEVRDQKLEAGSQSESGSTE